MKSPLTHVAATTRVLTEAPSSSLTLAAHSGRKKVFKGGGSEEAGEVAAGYHLASGSLLLSLLSP